MKILFIGGTGVISSACANLALEKGHDLWLLTRGSSFREIPAKAHKIVVDIRNPQQVIDNLPKIKFDVIVDFISFNIPHLENNIELFKNKCDQYIFISSASAYHKPIPQLPITEETALKNSFWDYSQKKIDCENFLMQQYHDIDFPVTIIRPSHTYDKTMIIFPLGRSTSFNRLKQGKKIILHDNGKSLWTVTHHADFAKGLIGLLGNHAAIGEAFHITSDEYLSWHSIIKTYTGIIKTDANIAYIPSEFILRHDKEWGDGLLGDKAHSKIFDNSKIKRFVPEFKASIPFFEGAQEIIDFYTGNPGFSKTDPLVEKRIENLLFNFTKST